MPPPFLPEVQAQLDSPNPEEAVRGLARLRSLAFSTGDFRLLDQVNVPASSAAVADGRISASLEESGRVLAGFTTLLTQVAATEDSGRRWPWWPSLSARPPIRSATPPGW